MATKKNDNLAIWAIVVLLGIFMFGGDKADAITPAGVDLCSVVEPEASFTAERMFVKGTAIATEYVRVFKMDGEGKDLGQTSTNSGTLSTTPNGLYRVMYGENSSTYYTQVEDYTAPCQDATDNKVGTLCYIDTDPTVTVFDENSAVQSASANAQAVTANDEVGITVRVKVAADKCFGNPSATGDNAICFAYNNSAFTSIEADTGTADLPYAVTAYSASGTSINCYNLVKLADRAQIDIPVTLKSGSSEVTLVNNASIYLDDIAFDLNADSLEEIWGFNDEDNNALGSAIVAGDMIYVS